MPTFNLFEYRRAQAEIPNGQSVSVVPNGAGMGAGEQGMMLSDGNAGGVGGEGQRLPLRDVVGDILSAANDGENPKEIGRLARRAVNVDVPQELNGNDNAMKMIIALGRRAMENQDIDTTDPESGNQEKSLSEIAAAIATEADWDVGELIREAKERGGAGEMGDTGSQGGVPPVATAGFLSTARQITAAGNGKGGGAAKNPLQKKKKGNPFKVLMGRVQKLLDHGIDERNQVVKTLMRQKGNRWKRETIEKAFTVVKDRNVRDERSRQSGGGEEMPQEKAATVRAFNMAEYLSSRRTAQVVGTPGTRGRDETCRQLARVLNEMESWDSSQNMWDENGMSSEVISRQDRGMRETLNEIRALGFYPERDSHGMWEVYPRPDDPNRFPREANVRAFNMAEYLGMKRTAENEKPEKQINDVRTEQRDSLYKVDRPMASLSMGELISRLQYLVTAVDSENTMMGENLVAYRGVDKPAMSKQADSIRAELASRGYDAEMLKRLFGIPDATKPSTNYQGERKPEPKQTKKPEEGREIV